MSILLLLIPLALVLAIVAAAAFFWAMRDGQFDDLDSPAMRVVLDDDSKPPPRIETADEKQEEIKER